MDTKFLYAEIRGLKLGKIRQDTARNLAKCAAWIMQKVHGFRGRKLQNWFKNLYQFFGFFQSQALAY